MGLHENVTWNVNGGQINYATDNSTINATQNNDMNTDELNCIVSIIKENLSGLSNEDAKTINDAIDMIKAELIKSEPKSSIISNGIKLIASMFTVANGIPILITNLRKFVGYVMQYIQ